METQRQPAEVGSRNGADEPCWSVGWSSLARPLFDGSSPAVCPIPDRPLCEACASEITDPSDRRYGYAFASCSLCGPRESILRRGAFIRANSVMADYPMCPACRHEYETASGRHFGDEIISCPSCGPTLFASNERGTTSGAEAALDLAARAILDGSIVALRDERRDAVLCDATSSPAVSRIRSRFRLFESPLVVMVRDRDEACRVADLDHDQLSLLTSVERPVVLVSIRTDSPLTGEVAAGNRLVGLLLPYTPLHHLLLKESGRPLVFAPAGVPDTPRKCDASTLLPGAELVLIADRKRAAVGSPPEVDASTNRDGCRAVRLERPVVRPILACGGALPGAVCLVSDDEAVIGRSTGAYGEFRSGARFEDSIERLESIVRCEAEVVVHDFDERLDSSRYALDRVGVTHVAVQQHHALLASCLTENAEAGEALGVVFDFGGVGTDGASWGGEIFRGSVEEIERLATFRPFLLAGEHVSTRQIWRVALSMLDDVWHGEPPLHAIPLFRSMPRRGIEVVRRLIDSGPNVRSHAIGLQLEALAAVLLCRTDAPYPGALIREMERSADPGESGRYPMVIRDGTQPWEIDFRPVVEHAVRDMIDGVAVAAILSRARNSVIAAVVEVLRAHGADRMPVAMAGDVLSGTQMGELLAVALGRDAMLLRPRAVTDGAGAIALGQALVADSLVRKCSGRQQPVRRVPNDQF